MKNTPLLILLFASSHSWAQWTFTEKSKEIGLSFTHSFDKEVTIREQQHIASGLAIGDINGDGWDDIFAVTGENLDRISGTNLNPNKLFISQQNGKYTEAAENYGLSSQDLQSSAPLIIDVNDDGTRDLLFGSVATNPQYHQYLNINNQFFVTSINQVDALASYSTSASDIDKDGDLDLAISHWLQDNKHILWENNGSGQFIDSTLLKLEGTFFLSTFSPVFSDINGDNTDDLLLVSDFSNSQYFFNNGTGTMAAQGNNQLTDENGMGVAVADYDNDGDLDWFVSSIYDPDGRPEGNWGVSGNRLYNNDGTGHFTDVTDQAGVRQGFWGWGSCFADFNNDMHLDLFHVNGFPSDILNEPEFVNDLSRLFISNGDGTFTERSEELGIIDAEQGRAIICFDSDRDGDLDILIHNNQGESKFYQNDLNNGNHYVSIKLKQTGGNMDAIGAKISIRTGNINQLRQVMAGASFASSNPTTQHFGLGQHTRIDSITITWPDGQIEEHRNVAVDGYYVLSKGQELTAQIIPVASNALILILLCSLVLLMTYFRIGKPSFQH